LEKENEKHLSPNLHKEIDLLIERYRNGELSYGKVYNCMGIAFSTLKRVEMAISAD